MCIDHSREWSKITNRFSVSAAVLVVRSPVELRFAAWVMMFRELSTLIDFRMRLAIATRLSAIADAPALSVPQLERILSITERTSRRRYRSPPSTLRVRGV